MAEKLFKKNMTLVEMDAVLEQFLAENSSAVRILADIPLSEEEYILLLDRLSRAGRDMATMQRYRLCVLMAWAYALHYGEESAVQYHMIMEELDDIPQYFVRQFLKVCGSTFEDFGLNTYYSEINSKQQLYSMMVAQAGIPDAMAPSFCELLEQLVEGKPLADAMEEMKRARNDQLGHAADASNSSFLEHLLLSAKEIMQDCQSGDYTEEELQKKYRITSSRLIHTCWCWAQERSLVCA